MPYRVGPTVAATTPKQSSFVWVEEDHRCASVFSPVSKSEHETHMTVL